MLRRCPDDDVHWVQLSGAPTVRCWICDGPGVDAGSRRDGEGR